MPNFSIILKSEPTLVSKIGNGNNQYTKNNGGGGKAATAEHSAVHSHSSNLAKDHSAVFTQTDHTGEEAGEPIHITNQGAGKYYAQAGGQDHSGTHDSAVSWAVSHAAGNGAKLTHYENVDENGDTVSPKKASKSDFVLKLKSDASFK